MKKAKMIKRIVVTLIVLLMLLVFVAKVEEIAEKIHNVKASLFAWINRDEEFVAEVMSSPLEVDMNAWYAADMTMISHAGGGIDGKAYLESKECLAQSQEENFTFYELDFILTSDNQIALRHDWTSDKYETQYSTEVPAYTEYINTPICYKYTPATIEDVFNLMKKNPNIYIITDCNIRMVLPVLIKQCENNGCEELLNRFIVQIYYEEDYEFVRGLWPFETIYTLYLQEDADYNEVIRFCLESDIHVVTMKEDRVSEDIVRALSSYNIRVYVHTINSILEMIELSQIGVTGIYTDFLIPADLQYMDKK